MFFHVSQGEDSAQPIVLPIEVSDKGAPASWPNGFFDQQSLNLRDIARASTGGKLD